jgi:hypothetical protein
MNDPRDLARARDQGWYRIPLERTPPSVAADFVAFYQTGAFEAGERWAVRWYAPVRGYHIATRRELIPEEPDHPRANDRYYRVDLGSLEFLPHPIPSRRLRRITFIRTTFARLLAAREINDLWIHTPAQERLWQAFQQAGLDDHAEHEYSLVDDLPYTADFAVFCDKDRIAVILTGETHENNRVQEGMELGYLLASGNWHAILVDPSHPDAVESCLAQIDAIRLRSKNSIPGDFL